MRPCAPATSAPRQRALPVARAQYLARSTHATLPAGRSAHGGPPKTRLGLSCGFARFHALLFHGQGRVPLRVACKRATQPNRVLGGLGFPRLLVRHPCALALPPRVGPLRRRYGLPSPLHVPPSAGRARPAAPAALRCAQLRAHAPARRPRARTCAPRAGASTNPPPAPAGQRPPGVRPPPTLRLHLPALTRSGVPQVAAGGLAGAGNRH
jgi:hypothetical protein